jgi:hypothetical protein
VDCRGGHAVVDSPDADLTVCGFPVGALTDWPTIRFPNDAADVSYCPGCRAGAAHDRGA